MGFQDFISENEASSFTGVSSVTLKRFADAGYLRVEVENDGLRMFSRAELESVFGLTNHAVNATPLSSPKKPEQIDIVREFSLRSQNTQHQTQVAAIEEHQAPEEVSPVEAVNVAPSESEVEPAATSTQSPTLQYSQVLLELEREVSRLRAVTELQEKYIDLKEGEVNSLKSERDWLRGRIEKLEEKNDRDQLILVSVSETNRGLITMLEHKKSPVRAALEWVGILPTPAPTPAVIRNTHTTPSQSS